MCGPFGHGWWWQDEATKEYVVVASFEINSHWRQKEIYKEEIPTHAHKWGFELVDLKAIENNSPSVRLPDEVITKIGLLTDMYFPDINSVIRFIRHNYAKNDDRCVWDDYLPQMLADNGDGLLFGKWHQLSEWNLHEIYNLRKKEESCQDKIQLYLTKALWHQRKGHPVRARLYKMLVTWYTLRIVRHKTQMAEVIRKTTYLQEFLDYFLAHPNAFWAKRKLEGREIPVLAEGELVRA